MRATLSTIKATTPLDKAGMSFGIERIPGELQYDYLERIYDRYKNPPGHTYDALTGAIARDLGLVNFTPLEIKLKALAAAVTIDGVTVTVSEGRLTDPGLSLDVDELVGMTLSINDVLFEIIENDATVIYVASNKLEYVVNHTLSPVYEIYNARNPFISVTRSRMILYSDYVNDNVSSIDLEIELNRYTTFLEVIDSINNSSRDFSATVLPSYKYDPSTLISKHIVPQNSVNIFPFSGNGGRYYNLGISNIVEESISTNMQAVLVSKKQTPGELATAGDYYVDRFSGELYTYTDMSPLMTVSLRYNTFPFRPKCSWVVLDDLRDEEYQRILFQQVEQEIYTGEADQYKNGKPLDQFFIDFNLINRSNNIYWGK